MLLEFKTRNYKCFADEISFSMTAAPKQSGLDYSLMKKIIKGKTIKGLCSSVVYGPNAAGKTNIIGAIDVLRSIILRGNIRNFEEKSNLNSASSDLELIPNNKKEKQPVFFSIKFYIEESDSNNNCKNKINKRFQIQYELEIDLGTFFDIEYSRKITSEKLTINDEPVFYRHYNDLIIKNLKIIKDYLSDSVKLMKNADDIAKNSLSDDELFLTNGFKLIFSQKFVKIIVDWFADKLIIIYSSNSTKLIKRFADPLKNPVYISKTIEAARLFGISSNGLAYSIGEDDIETNLFSMFKGFAIPSDIFESYGTIRFINIFTVIVRAILTGGILIADEFDVSIHPMALMNIINIFHNDDINIHNAQLIFNSHNPIFLNPNLFRRDEIKFVERDDQTHLSTLYSLSDFGTTGEKGVRKYEDYMKNYFINQYGAIKDVDFTPIFEKIITSEREL